MEYPERFLLENIQIIILKAFMKILPLYSALYH